MSARRHDLAGQRFGRLLAIEDAGNDAFRSRRWRCRCDCGAECIVLARQLKSGKTQSCGCMRREVLRRQRTESPVSRLYPAEYHIWKAMCRRCLVPTDRSYSSYGGRGVAVCERWSKKADGFRNFLDDMGRRPSPKHSLDRIDVDGNYEPSNVRWATPEQQANNKRNSAKVTAFGETLTVTEWSRKTGIDRQAIAYRVKKGWSPEQAVSALTRQAK